MNNQTDYSASTTSQTGNGNLAFTGSTGGDMNNKAHVIPSPIIFSEKPIIISGAPGEQEISPETEDRFYQKLFETKSL
jgi:hypothetical protein